MECFNILLLLLLLRGVLPFEIIVKHTFYTNYTLLSPVIRNTALNFDMQGSFLLSVTCCCPQFLDKNIEAQRSKVSWSFSTQGQNWNLTLV